MTCYDYEDVRSMSEQCLLLIPSTPDASFVLLIGFDDLDPLAAEGATYKKERTKEK